MRIVGATQWVAGVASHDPAESSRITFGAGGNAGDGSRQTESRKFLVKTTTLLRTSARHARAGRRRARAVPRAALNELDALPVGAAR